MPLHCTKTSKNLSWKHWKMAVFSH